MGKIWIGVLVVGAIVLVLALWKGPGRGDGRGEPRGGRPSHTYGAIETRLRGVPDPYGRRMVLAELRELPVRDTGWVISVAPAERGGQRVMITVKAPAGTVGGEADIVADVAKEDVRPGVQLVAGQKVECEGPITEIETAPKLVVHIGPAAVTLRKK